eukprot:2803212-Pleurochrysis_carterae.AAC.6
MSAANNQACSRGRLRAVAPGSEAGQHRLRRRRPTATLRLWPREAGAAPPRRTHLTVYQSFVGLLTKDTALTPARGGCRVSRTGHLIRSGDLVRGVC